MGNGLNWGREGGEVGFGLQTRWPGLRLVPLTAKGFPWPSAHLGDGLLCNLPAFTHIVPSPQSPSPAQEHLSISESAPMPPVRPRHPPGLFSRPLSKTHPHLLAWQVLVARNALPPLLEGTREQVKELGRPGESSVGAWLASGGVLSLGFPI